MADPLTERCWFCTKLCDAERGCLVAPEAYAGHDVLACSDNHFNRAYEMAMGMKPANRTFYDFARVAERRDEGRGKDYGFRIKEIIFEPNFPPYRRDELSKSLRAESFEANSIPYDFNKMPAIFKSWRRNTAYCINDGNENTLCGTGDRWSSRGHGSAGLNRITCQRCKSKWNKLTDEDIKRIEEAWERNGFMDSSWYGAETFEASQYPSLKLTENQESKLRWFKFAYYAHSIKEHTYIDEVLGDISPNLWTQATTVGLPFTIEKISRESIMRNASKASDDENAKRMQKRTLSQLVKKGIFEVNESFEDKEVPFTINVKLTPKAEKAVKDDIDDLRSLVAETFEAEYFTSGQKNDLIWFYLAYEAYATNKPVGSIYPDEWEKVALDEGHGYDVDSTGYDLFLSRRTLKSLLKKGLVEATHTNYIPGDARIRKTDAQRLNENPDLVSWLKFVRIKLTSRGAELIKKMYSQKELGAESFEAEQIQYDVMKGKFSKGYEYANYISLHDSFEEAEAVAKRERKKLEKDEAIFIVEESFDDETFELDTTLLRSISKSPMIESFPDASKDSFGAEGYKECCTKDNIRVHHRGGAIYHDDEAELTYYPAECMVCGRDYEAGLPMYSSSTEIVKLDAEALVIPDGDSVPYHILKRLDKEGIRYRYIEGNYEAETFEAKGGKRMYCPNCKTNRTWNSAFKKENMDNSKGEKPSDFIFYVCQKCDYAYDPKTGKKMEDNWREMFGYDAETFEATCRDCYGTGGLYDSRLGIDDECASCGGTGESFEAESVSDLELKKDSCCCGATKKTPCVCMILGSDCSAKKPMCACYRLKEIQQKDEKGAETFEAKGRKKKPKIKGMFTRNTDITSRFNPDNPTQGWLKKSCLVVGCDNEVMVQNQMEGKRCLKCYDLMMNEQGYYDSTGNGKYVEGEKRPQWMANLMKDSVEEEGDGTYNRHDKGFVAGLFLKSVNDARLNGILKQTNYQDSDLIGSDSRKELKISLSRYEPIALKDPLAEIFGVRIDDSGKYIIFNDTAYNVKIFKSMIGGLPPNTKIRISGKPKYPLMFEFDYLTEPYIMFLAPMVFDDSSLNEKIKQHQDFGKGFLRKEKPKISDPNKTPDDIIQRGKDAKERLDKRAKMDSLNKETKKIKDSISDEDKEELFKYTNLKSRKENNFTMEEIISYYEGLLSKYSGNDPDFDPEKADRNKDGEISDWERAVGNAVAKGIREHKERKEAETFGAWDANCSLCNGTGWMPKKGDPKKDAKLAKLFGLSIDELTLTPCKAGGKSMGCWSENNSSRLRRLQRAESRPVSYMVKSDAHKLNEASKRIHDKADEKREYPEWWKSKLSVVRNDADKLSDFLDYAVVEGVFESEGDHDHEEIDELIDKLNTVVDFAITFVHDGGYGGEPKGILVDEDLGIKTEIVHYIEGSIQLNLVRDIDTNELLSVRFSLTGDPDQTPIVYLPLPEEITTVPEDDRVSAKN